MKLIFLGPPGSGKGTVAAKASERFYAPHVSTGDIFRRAIAAGTPFGLKAKVIIGQGRLVDDDTTISLVRERLGEADVKDSFILDGFPRTLPQAVALDGFSMIDRVISFDIPANTVIERLAGRLVCRRCGLNWNKAFNPPEKPGVCDRCGGELYTRDDDKPEAVNERLAEYRELTFPLIEYYRGKSLLTAIDVNRGADAIVADMEEALRASVPKANFGLAL
jgi:adenylate kinase